MILGWSAFKVVQMVTVHCISRSQELKIDFLTKSLKNLLVRNHWTDFNIILQKCSFGDPLPRLFKPFGFVKKHGRQGAGAYFPYISIKKTLKIFLSETTGPICRNVPLVILYQDCSSHLDSSKTWPPGGGAYFPYISI